MELEFGLGKNTRCVRVQQNEVLEILTLVPDIGFLDSSHIVPSLAVMYPQSKKPRPIGSHLSNSFLLVIYPICRNVM